MKWSLWLSLRGTLVMLLLLSTAGVTAEDKIGVALKLDHFKIYHVEPVETKASVSLRGQFDEKPIPGRLPAIERFANPVSKDGSKIIDPHAHLAWYKLLQRFEEPKRVVKFENQFGEGKAVIGKAVALLVPSEKVEPGSRFPERLDHYKLFAVLESEPVSRKVTLKDQFGDDSVKIGKTVLFGVPVMKRHGDKEHRIINEKGHLVIYEILPKKPTKLVKETRDQFGAHKLRFIESEMLAVPSYKLGFEVIK